VSFCLAVLQMSLLGRQVFANPTTPLWGTEGPGPADETFSNVTIVNNGQITFQNPAGNSVLSMDGALLTVSDPSGNFAPVGTSEIRTYDGVGSYVSMGQTSNGFGLGAYLDDGTLQNTLATFGSGGWSLSNVTSINGVPYAAPVQAFDYQDYPAGLSLVDGPTNWTTLNTITVTPPKDGKLYMESMGRFLGTVLGGTAVLTFGVNGSNVTDPTPVALQAYDSNINFSGGSIFQIDVSGGVSYAVTSLGQCSALPPAAADVVALSTRLSTLFTAA